MYINLKKLNVNNYKMARVSLKIRLGTQEGILYISLSKADGGRGSEGAQPLGSFVLLWMLYSVFAVASPLTRLHLARGGGR